LLRPLLEGARAIFGGSLMKAVTWAPKVWSLIYRDAGEMVVAERQRGAIALELRQMPLVIAASANYLQGSDATFSGFFDVAGVQGAADLAGPDLATRSARFTLRWGR
jgi:hypothetical protein